MYDKDGFDQSLFQTNYSKTYSSNIVDNYCRNKGVITSKVSFGHQTYSLGSRANCYIHLNNLETKSQIIGVNIYLMNRFSIRIGDDSEINEKRSNHKFFPISISPGQKGSLAVGIDINENDIKPTCYGRT